MKVLILTHTFPKNNDDTTAAFMKPFSDGLVEAGNDVVVLTPFAEDFDRRKDPFKLVVYKYIWPQKLHSLGYSQTMTADVSLKKHSYFLIPFMLFFGTLKLLRMIKNENIDLINVHWILPNGVMALIASKITGIPYVVTLPGTDVLVSRKNKLFSEVARLVANNASGITSNSSWLLSSFKKIGGVDKNVPTKVISYPADVSDFKPDKKGLKSLRKKYNLKKSDVILLSVGRMVYKKGFDYLIKAIKTVVDANPKVKLILIGDGDVRAELENLCRELSLEDNIIFAGTVDRKRIKFYYNLSDIMVAPSVVDKNGNADGGPVVVLESMACAKPQILTDILGMADNVKDGVGGFVVPEKNSKKLAEAIIKLVENPKLRKKMGKVNRETAVRNLSTKGVGEAYAKFFEKIIKNK